MTQDSSAFSYVLPVRMSHGEQVSGELLGYLDEVREWCDDVIVVDGSPPDAFAANHDRIAGRALHVMVDLARRSQMGKVGGVLTGLDLARHERTVIADDDVRFDRAALQRVITLLGDYHLVRPQNYFAPLPWHARWDTARTLLNRALGADYPGTLAVRRSVVLELGGYDGNVLFENLELIRTVKARGGTLVAPLDLFVRRLPPATAHFWGQRTRQAYDDFAIPARMALWLSIAPSLAWCVARRRTLPLLTAATASVLIAEVGRRRGRGAKVFPVTSSLLAPLWIAERGVCSWLAVLQKVRFGGVRYGDSIVRVAAHSRRHLRHQAARDRRCQTRAAKRSGRDAATARSAIVTAPGITAPPVVADVR